MGIQKTTSPNKSAVTQKAVAKKTAAKKVAKKGATSTKLVTKGAKPAKNITTTTKKKKGVSESNLDRERASMMKEHAAAIAREQYEVMYYGCGMDAEDCKKEAQRMAIWNMERQHLDLR